VSYRTSVASFFPQLQIFAWSCAGRALAGVFFPFHIFLRCVAPRFPKRFYLACVPPGSGTGSWRHFFPSQVLSIHMPRPLAYKYNKASASLGYHSHLATKMMVGTRIDLNVAPPLDENYDK
jgi:hypothetical protein